MKIFSKCSNYLPITICGKNIAHDKKYHTQENSQSSIIFQKKESWAHIKNQIKEVTKSDFHKSKEIQIENIMFYTSKKEKKEELERYQDCSWFQEKTNKEDFISKFSQAEALISPGIKLDEFDLSMQFANGDIPPWGDDYLEVFDEDSHFDLDNKKAEKENDINPSTVPSTYINCDLGEEDASDIYNYDNYAIRKVDSYDKLKIITSTNPSDIIPISYQEQLNNSNYNMQNLGIKNEIKKEPDAYSPESVKYVIESDDGDLNIGREEVIEVESNNDNEMIDEKSLKALPVEYQTSIVDLGKCVEKENILKTDLMKPQVEELPSMICNQENGKSGFLLQRAGFENSNEGITSTANKQLKLRIEPNKAVFDSTTLGATTPELCFMDLVNYINNEKLSDYLDTSSIIHLEESETSSFSLPFKESSSNMVAATPEKALNKNVSQMQTNSCETTVFSDPDIKKTEKSDPDTISNEDLTKTMSIAERIKIGAPRKRTKRYDSDKLKFFHDENWENDAQDKNDDSYGDEEDYNCKTLIRKRKYSRSSYSGSISLRSVQDEKFEDELYRERRNKNNAASRRSRQNKKIKERLMFRSLEEAERKNAVLKEKADKLEKLVVNMRQMLLQVVLKKGKET